MSNTNTNTAAERGSVAKPAPKTKAPAGPAIFAKMSDVLSEIGAIGKDKTNAAQGFKFRGIDQMLNALYPVLSKHRVFISPAVVGERHELREVTRSSGKTGLDKYVSLLVEYTFYTEDGSSVKVGPIASEGIDSGDKATNKALSAALKYALIQTFSIPTEDMEDGDSVSPELAPKRFADRPSPQMQAPVQKPLAGGFR